MASRKWTQNSIPEIAKTYLNSDNLQGLVFSYQIETTAFTNTGTLVLQQQETGISLKIQLALLGNQWVVRKFTLNEKSQLAEECLSLYDAAMVEIALQALDLLFFMARAVQIEAITFQVGIGESEHLLSFDSFFDPRSGGSPLLTLPTSTQAHAMFMKKTKEVKTKIYQELWQRQWREPLLRCYFQTHQKGTLFPFTYLTETPEPAVFKENILLFPKRAATALSLQKKESRS